MKHFNISHVFIFYRMTAVLKEIKKLNLNKATQDSYIPVKVFFKKNDFFADYIYLQFTETSDSSNFEDIFKSAYIVVVRKVTAHNIVSF